MRIQDYTSIGNTKIYFDLYSEVSRKETLVLLHEGLGSVAQWKDIPEWLFKNTHFNILVYDRSGYGRSSPVDQDYPINYPKFEAQFILPQLLKVLNINSCSLFGHSDGGTIALLFAAYNPESTIKVITIAAHVIIEDMSRKGIENVRKIYTEKLQKPLTRYHGNKADWVFYHWADTWLNPDFYDWNMLEELQQIKCPVLAIQGDNDEYGSIKQLDLIAQLSKGETKLIKNSGHHPHFQYRNEVLKMIIRFLETSFIPN